MGAYGIYRALYLPAMLVGPAHPALLACFLLQAVLGILSGVAVWYRARSAPLLIVLLGVAVALTALIEAFAFGIVAYLYALLVAVVANVVTVILAAYVGRGGGT